MFKFFLGWFLGAFGVLGIALTLGGFWLWGQWQHPTVLPKNWNKPKAYAISTAKCYRAFESILQVKNNDIKGQIAVLNEECPILPQSVRLAKDAMEAACTLDERLSCDNAKAVLYKKWLMAKDGVSLAQSKASAFTDSLKHLAQLVVDKARLKFSKFQTM